MMMTMMMMMIMLMIIIMVSGQSFSEFCDSMYIPDDWEEHIISGFELGGVEQVLEYCTLSASRHYHRSVNQSLLLQQRFYRLVQV